jgi:hypothetical protein
MRLITILRCTMVAMIVALPATAGCRQPWKSQLVSPRDDARPFGPARFFSDAPEPTRVMNALLSRG